MKGVARELFNCFSLICFHGKTVHLVNMMNEIYRDKVCYRWLPLLTRDTFDTIVF
jgi:hypothetical protein